MTSFDEADRLAALLYEYAEVLTAAAYAVRDVQLAGAAHNPNPTAETIRGVIEAYDVWIRRQETCVSVSDAILAIPDVDSGGCAGMAQARDGLVQELVQSRRERARLALAAEIAGGLDPLAAQRTAVTECAQAVVDGMLDARNAANACYADPSPETADRALKAIDEWIGQIETCLVAWDTFCTRRSHWGAPSAAEQGELAGSRTGLVTQLQQAQEHRRTAERMRRAICGSRP